MLAIGATHLTVREIILYPDARLSKKTEAVARIDSEIERLLDDMAETMYDAPGVGLAAPQVGILKRVMVIDTSQERNRLYQLVNPEIVFAEGEMSSEEGCLSIPGYRDTLSRKAVVRVRALDRQGKPIEVEGQDLLAACLQHEIDHLDGVLFVDRLSRLKREMFKKWVKKQGTLEPE